MGEWFSFPPTDALPILLFQSLGTICVITVSSSSSETYAGLSYSSLSSLTAFGVALMGCAVLVTGVVMIGDGLWVSDKALTLSGVTAAGNFGILALAS